MYLFIGSKTMFLYVLINIKYNGICLIVYTFLIIINNMKNDKIIFFFFDRNNYYKIIIIIIIKW